MKKRLFGLILLVSLGMDILGSHRGLRRALPLAKAVSNFAPVNVYAQAKPLRIVASAASSYFQIKNYSSHSVVKADEYLEKAANDSCDFKTFSRVEIVKLAKIKNKEFIEDIELKRISDGTACNLSEVFRNHPIFTEVILPTTPGYYLWKFFGVENDFTKMIDHLSELDVCMQADILNNTINLIGKGGDLSDEDVFISLLDILSMSDGIDTLSARKLNSVIIELLDSYAYKLESFGEESTHKIVSLLLDLKSNKNIYFDRLKHVNLYKYIKYLNQDLGLSYFSKKACISDNDVEFYLSFDEEFWTKNLKNKSYLFVDKCFECMPFEKQDLMFNKCFPDCRGPFYSGIKPSIHLAERELEQVDCLKYSCDTTEDFEFLDNLSKQFSESINLACKYNRGVNGPLDVKNILDDFYKIKQLANLFESVSDGNLSKYHFDKYVKGRLKQELVKLKKEPLGMGISINSDRVENTIVSFIDTIGGVEEFEKIMHKESDLIDSEYVTFYHSQAVEYGYQIEMRKCLANILSEHGLAKKIQPDFVPIQSCPVAYSLDEDLSRLKVINAVDEHETLMVGDYTSHSRPPHLLSVNIFLFGRLEAKACCTVEYVVDGNNIRDIDVNLYDNVFKDLGVSNYVYRKYESEIQEFMDFYKEVYGSNLLQIAVPKDKVDDWVYLSDAGAKKRVDHEVNKFIETVDEFGYIELDTFSECAMPLTSAYMLNPDSGVKIFNYPVIRNATKADELKEKMQELVSRIVADMRDELAYA